MSPLTTLSPHPVLRRGWTSSPPFRTAGVPDRPREGSAMRRRDFIALSVGSVATWPLAARAQQPAIPVIGFLSGRSPETDAPLLAIFRQNLNEAGFVEGRNVAFEYHAVDGQYDGLPGFAA